jgi:hypothetical protein
VGAFAAAIDGEVGADGIVCEAAQGSTNIEERENKRTLCFIEVVIASPCLFPAVDSMHSQRGRHPIQAKTGAKFAIEKYLLAESTDLTASFGQRSPGPKPPWESTTNDNANQWIPGSKKGLIAAT